MIKTRLSNNVFSYFDGLKNNIGINENKQLMSPSSKNIVTKYITFDELCPIWSKKLSLGLDKVDKFMIERDSKYCIVGEAWQFSGKYAGYYFAPLIPFVGCWECIKYMRKFANISKKKANVTKSDFEHLIEYFMIHWNKKHINEKI